VTGLASSRGPSRSPVSLLLSKADRYASRPAAAVLVVGAAGAWLIVSIVAGFPGRWETIFETVVAALTLAMVFDVTVRRRLKLVRPPAFGGTADGAPGGQPQLCRSTNSVGRSSTRCGRLGAAMRSRSWTQARSPSERIGWWTVVSGGSHPAPW
jgi:hypothetical protein